jgi:hypothetical protein
LKGAIINGLENWYTINVFGVEKRVENELQTEKENGKSERLLI